MYADQTTKTALDLITGALRKIGQYAPGETLDPMEANDALDGLNGMLDILSNQNLSVYNQIETVENLSAGVNSYTIGVGGYFNIERPYNIAKMYSRMTTASSTVDFGCEEITLQKYGSIGLKTQPGPWPKQVYYNSGWPMGNLLMWPVPQSAIEFHLWTDMVFTALNLTDVVAMPRGYYLGLQCLLCGVLAPDYGASVPPGVAVMAKDFKAVLEDQNARPQGEVACDPAQATSGGADAGWFLNGGFQ
jgi:hypothetical protein